MCFRDLKNPVKGLCFTGYSNSFVFYVDERMEYYSEELKENVITFSVTGWDILIVRKSYDKFNSE